MANLVSVTDQTFDEAVMGSHKPVLVDFWAPWCGPCLSVAPLLEEIADEFAGQLTIVKVNVDENPGVAGKMGVRSIPTMSLFADGEVVARHTGSGSLNQLRTFLKANL